MPRIKNNYINNKTLYAEMIKHRNLLLEAKQNNLPDPIASKYIGESILKICNNLASKSNFSGYSYKSDMISDGIIDCVAAINNFNPDKTTNPFAYFTQVAWNAFIRRIHKEKKQNYIKHKNFENSFVVNEMWDNGNYSMQFKTNDYSSDVVKNFENTLTKNKKEVKLKGIEKFSNGEIDEESTSSSN